MALRVATHLFPAVMTTFAKRSVIGAVRRRRRTTTSVDPSGSRGASTLYVVMALQLLGLLLLLLCSAQQTMGMEAQKLVWPSPSVLELYTASVDPPMLQVVNRDDFGFVYSGHAQNDDEAVQVLLDKAKDRFFTSLDKQVPSSSHTRPVNPDGKVVWNMAGLRIQITTNDDNNSRLLKHGVDESYALEVRPVIDSDSFVLLSAPTVFGAMRGLQTLLQVLEFGWIDTRNGQAVYIITNPPLLIVDRPVYPYRGLMIDTSRHYLPLPLILSNLDAMEMNKLNVLHWHVTDSQSWPYKSAMYPELAAKGAYCDECVYDATDIQQVVDEAAVRGIRVVVEFDLPGHSQAIGASHPEFLSDCGPKGRREPLDATSTAAMDFVVNLYKELDGLLVDDWIHVGGDEVSLDCWKASKHVHHWLKRHNMTDPVELLGHFESQLLDFVTRGLGKKPIVWQELYSSGLRLPSETVVDIWQNWNDFPVRERATLSHDVLISSCWYLDHLDEDWQSFYRCDPRAFNGTVQQKRRVLGGHASMWGERVDEQNFMSRVWPRAAATAEKLWTGSKDNATRTAAARLDRFRCLMVARGFPASPIQPGYCDHDRLHAVEEELWPTELE